MRIYEDIDIRNFKFWSGAKDRVGALTNDDWDVIEPLLDDLYPDGMSDGELNDFFWFEFDTIAQWLGYESEEDMDHKRESEDEEDEEDDD